MTVSFLIDTSEETPINSNRNRKLRAKAMPILLANIFLYNYTSKWRITS